jgi:hypothetical protein
MSAVQLNEHEWRNLHDGLGYISDNEEKVHAFLTKHVDKVFKVRREVYALQNTSRFDSG